jgi:hypothetical protein
MGKKILPMFEYRRFWPEPLLDKPWRGEEEPIENLLNRLAADGWELVQVFHTPGQSYSVTRNVSPDPNCPDGIVRGVNHEPEHFSALMRRPK